MSSSPTPWSTRAVNLPENAHNPVHTEAGGLAAGYAGAVVAGTTIYSYLTRPAAEAWGVAWIGGGSAAVRFHAPVLADEPVDIVPTRGDDGTWVIEALGPSGRCASLEVGLEAGDPGVPDGERLEPLVLVLDDEWVGYAARGGEDLAIYDELDVVHPAIWPALANRVFAVQLVEGAWVHTRSAIRHLDTARPGETVVLESWLTDRFTTRAGDRAVVDIRVSVDGRPVVAIEHEAIVRLKG